MRNRFVLVTCGLLFVLAFSAFPSIPNRQEARRTPSRVDEKRLNLTEASQLTDQLLDLFLKDKFRDGIKLAERIEQIYAQAPANCQVDHATSLNNLGVLYHASGDYNRAGPLYRRALESFKPTLGEEHPDYVTAFNILAEQVPGVVRGLGFEDAPPVKDGRLPPYYWGALLLSGDWH